MTYSAEWFRAVRIDYEVDTSDTAANHRPVLFTFDVKLVDAKDRAKLVAMFRPSELPQARALAQDIADLLHLDLSDHSVKWDPATRGNVPADIMPVREWLERRGLGSVPLDIATWIARGVHFIVDEIIQLGT